MEIYHLATLLITLSIVIINGPIRSCICLGSLSSATINSIDGSHCSSVVWRDKNKQINKKDLVFAEQTNSTKQYLTNLVSVGITWCRQSFKYRCQYDSSIMIQFWWFFVCLVLSRYQFGRFSQRLQCLFCSPDRGTSKNIWD